jgi:acyl-CoA synthetase (AMP-forming)/AMP-acid ligase II
MLDERARRHPERDAIAFVPDIRSGAVADRLTYGQLAGQAREIGCWLAVQGYQPGQRIVLLFPAGLGFARAFFACGYAGLVAVPVPPPDDSRASAERVQSVLADSQPDLVLTDDATLPRIRAWLDSRPGPGERTGLDGIRCLAMPPAGAGAAAWTPHPGTAGDLALLQYTSGSTSEPRGVMITHGNLLANLETAHAFLGRPRARGCGWLPLTHDMGLIGQLLFTVYTGGWGLLLPPTEFIKRPYRWLELMAEYGAQHAIAPNFAYDLCVRTVSEERIVGLDLSRWTLALNGAEPIDIRTLEAFAKKFGPAGFTREAFLPCYGLAEATLFVVGTPHDQPPRVTVVDAELLSLGRFAPAAQGTPARPLVSSGTTTDDSVLIVDPRTRRPLGEREVGEIWVTGPSVGLGYWGQAELTERTFHARPADGRPGYLGTGYLRTGDLGVLDGRQLYVTGRLKDVIITRGRNLYPQDLENAVREQAGTLRFGAAAVFALTGDDIVVVQELQRVPRGEYDFGPVASRVKQDLAQHFGAGRTSVVFVRPATVRKTTSGKTRRSEMRRLFLESALNPIYESLAPGVSEQLRERA